MKKILALVLALAMVATFAACGKDATSSTDGAATAEYKLGMGVVVSLDSSADADAEKGSAAFNGKEVRLSQKETELFILLLSRVGECVERREIQAMLWGDKDCGNDCDVYICHLRKKLESIAGPGVIVSVRGRGYMLKKP